MHKLQYTKALSARAYTHTLLSGLVSLSCSQSFIMGTRMRAGYGDSFHTHSHRIRSNPAGIFSYSKLFCLFSVFFFLSLRQNLSDSLGGGLHVLSLISFHTKLYSMFFLLCNVALFCSCQQCFSVGLFCYCILFCSTPVHSIVPKTS